MKVRYFSNSTHFSSGFTISISQFTEKEKEDILNTTKMISVSTISAPGLITISCKDEKSFNWILLKYLDTANK